MDIGKDEALGVKPATMLMVPTVFGEVETGRLEVELEKEEKPEVLTDTMLRVLDVFDREAEFAAGRESAILVGRSSVVQNLLQVMGTISAPRLKM